MSEACQHPGVVDVLCRDEQGAFQPCSACGAAVRFPVEPGDEEAERAAHRAWVERMRDHRSRSITQP